MPRHDARDSGYDAAASPSPRARRAAVTEDESALGPVTQGKIKTLNTDRGFGFIKDGAGQEYFFHRSETAGAFDTFEQGDPVEFTPMASAKGPRAHNVRRV